jgi:hypothetical protein
MPAGNPFRRAVALRLALVGMLVTALVLGGLVLARRTADAGATGELTVQATASGAVGDVSGLRPVSGEVAALVPGEQSWVKIPWTSDAAVCAVSVTVAADGATVAYPWTTKAFSSFYREDRLAAAATDYTAVRVQLPSSVTARSVPAEVTARFTTAAGAAGTCTGVATTRTYRVLLPVRA